MPYNIFEGVKIGTRFKTRDETIVEYIGKSQYLYYVRPVGRRIPYTVHSNGYICDFPHQKNSNSDVLSVCESSERILSPEEKLFLKRMKDIRKKH